MMKSNKTNDDRWELFTGLNCYLFAKWSESEKATESLIPDTVHDGLHQILSLWIRANIKATKSEINANPFLLACIFVLSDYGFPTSINLFIYLFLFFAVFYFHNLSVYFGT